MSSRTRGGLIVTTEVLSDLGNRPFGRVHFANEGELERFTLEGDAETMMRIAYRLLDVAADLTKLAGMPAMRRTH